MPVLIEFDGCIIEHSDYQKVKREIASKMDETLMKKTRLSAFFFFEKLNIRRNR